MVKRQSFNLGLVHSGPICLAFLFLGLSFGAISNIADVSLWQTIVMSVFVYSMPLQVLLVSMIENGGTILIVLTTTFLINFRFSMMTATLLPYFKNIKTWLVLLTLPLLSASAFTVSHVKFEHPSKREELDHFYYYLGVASAGFIVSLVFTILGFYINGIAYSSFMTNLLTMILPVHFTALTAMRWPELKAIFSTILGFVLMPLGHLLSDKYALILTPIVVGLIFTFLHKKELK